MNKIAFKSLILAAVLSCIMLTSCKKEPASTSESKKFTVEITDKPLTFCNPIALKIGDRTVPRAGEPVVVIFKDDYYLFITGMGGGYWYSKNMRDWKHVDAPDFPGGCPSVVSDGETLYASGDKSRHEVFSSTDPKSGAWKQVGTYQRDYGDADMFIDDDGRFYMYWGWSQILPFQVVELDPKNEFKEKGEPVTCFFGDYESHGFERRRDKDVVFPFFTHRPYFPEESPWIEGPWMVKHNGKYYLQYAAIGLEFSTYSHGVYVADKPMGPFVYSPHNPLTFKTTGFMVGAGHGSTFHDKNGNLWTIAMVPTNYGGRGSSDLALFPTAVDAEGVMHSNTAFGDYPQYYPGIKENNIASNFTNWMLLSNKKRVEASSILEGFNVGNAVDENFMTHWCAETGEPGEYLTIDLGKGCNIHAIQINFDQNGANIKSGRRWRIPENEIDTLNRSYTFEVSVDNKNWSMLVNKSGYKGNERIDYTELSEPVKARYVKLTNIYTPYKGKFAVKELRIFGNPEVAKFTKVNEVNVVRDPEDRRNVKLLWQPVEGADGYVVRYGIEPNKLYNNHIVYDDYALNIHSLNRDEEYYFEVEAFDSGTEYYRERTEQTMGRGAEIELAIGREMIERKMIKEGVNEYVFENVKPDQEYTLRHTFGPVMWRGKLAKAELIGADKEPTITEVLSKLGTGTKVLGQIEMQVIPGKESGKIVVTLKYDKP